MKFLILSLLLIGCATDPGRQPELITFVPMVQVCDGTAPRIFVPDDAPVWEAYLDRATGQSIRVYPDYSSSTGFGYRVCSASDDGYQFLFFRD